MVAPAKAIPLFTGAVLAGGRSLRMGTDKAFLRTKGELLIVRQIRCLKECGASEILISGHAGADYSALGPKIVYDECPGLGPLAAISTLMKVASFSHLLVLAVDLPELTSAYLKEILAGCEENVGCVPVDQSGFQPLAAVYPISLRPVIQRRLQEGHYSMRAFVSEAVSQGMERTIPVAPQDERLFVNWNRPSDWQHG